MFTQQLDRYVIEGDSISCSVKGIDYTARLVRDIDSRPTDYDCFDPNDPDHGEENQQILDAWENDEWHYFGVVVSASKGAVELDDHCASLWGIEGNFPGGTNDYFLEVANELLAEAIDQAHKRLEEMKATLAA